MLDGWRRLLFIGLGFRWRVETVEIAAHIVGSRAAKDIEPVVRDIDRTQQGRRNRERIGCKQRQ